MLIVLLPNALSGFCMEVIFENRRGAREWIAAVCKAVARAQKRDLQIYFAPSEVLGSTEKALFFGMMLIFIRTMR